MLTEHSNLLALYGALVLPVMLLYVLVFISIADRGGRINRSKPIVSIRDAAVSTIALDFAALSDLLLGGYPRTPSQVTLVAILSVAFVAHFFALYVFVRKSSELPDQGAVPREPLSEALERLESRPPSGFVVRLTSLYVAAILLITNGTTLLAVLELVRSGR